MITSSSSYIKKVVVTKAIQCVPAVVKANKMTLKLSLTKNFGDVGIVHVWIGLEYFPSFVLGPNHERVHRPFDMRCRVLFFPILSYYFGSENLRVCVRKRSNVRYFLGFLLISTDPKNFFWP